MTFELSPELLAEIDRLKRRYPRQEAALLPILHHVQGELGHLDAQVQARIAELLQVPPVLVHEVVTFYEMFHEHPEGQYHLELCTNIACHLRGADGILEHLKKKLGIAVGHQTEDGLFGLMEAECLGSCGSGPAMRVGDDYYEHLEPGAVDALVTRFKVEASALGGKPYRCGKHGPHTGPVPGFDPPRPPAVEAAPATSPGDGAADKPPEADTAGAQKREGT